MECISGINATEYGPHGYETLLSIVACTLMGRMRAFFATLVGGHWSHFILFLNEQFTRRP
jgi:hypothetical protein